MRIEADLYFEAYWGNDLWGIIAFYAPKPHYTSKASEAGFWHQSCLWNRKFIGMLIGNFSRICLFVRAKQSSKTKIEICVKKRKFCQKSKIWSKTENVVKNRKFSQKSKILSKIENFEQNRQSCLWNRNFIGMIIGNFSRICLCRIPAKQSLKNYVWNKVYKL